MLPIRVTAAERAAIRAAAKWENKKVSEFIRAAIAVRAEQGFCKATRDGDQRPPESGGRVSARLYASAESPLPATRPSQVRAGASIRELEDGVVGQREKRRPEPQPVAPEAPSIRQVLPAMQNCTEVAIDSFTRDAPNPPCLVLVHVTPVQPGRGR